MGRAIDAPVARPGLPRPGWDGPRPVWLAAPALALSALLPWPWTWFCALAAVILLGVPHGALDGEIARALLRPRLGRGWFAAFSLPYMALFAAVLACWHAAPVPTLAAFLAASAWHFGSEDAGPAGGWVEILAKGGLPIAMAVLARPGPTALVFGTVAGVPLDGPPGWLWAASLGWGALAVVWAGRAWRRGGGVALTGGLAALFVALPPLTAFAIYFVCVHAPAHVAALIGNARRAPRVRDRRSATVLALPITALTLAIGAALWPLYGGPAPSRLLSLTIQVLSALTLPHMLLDAWLTRREQRAA